MTNYKIASLGDPDVLLMAKIDHLLTKVDLHQKRIDELEGVLEAINNYDSASINFVNLRFSYLEKQLRFHYLLVGFCVFIFCLSVRFNFW